MLTMVGLGAGVLALITCDRRADLAKVFPIASSMVMIADWVVFGWFDLYAYRPYLLQSPVADEVLGILLSDIIYVPSFAVFLVHFLRGLPGIMVGTVAVTLLEWYFLHLGYFHHHGWRVWYTTVGFALYFAAVDLFWHDVRTGLLPPARLRAIIRATLIFSMISLLTLFLRGSELVRTNIHLRPTYEENQALGRFLWYIMVVGPAGYWALSGRGNRRWYRLAALTAALTVMNFGLAGLNIQHFLPPWGPVTDALAQGVVIAAAGWIEDLIMGV